MKKLLSAIPLVAFLATSCQQNTPVAETLPPVVKKAPTVTSKPKKRNYRSNRPSSKPKVDPVLVKKEETIDPLTPDPTSVVQVAEIPRFEVPDNLQPKVSDGINQAEFIELKW